MKIKLIAPFLALCFAMTLHAQGPNADLVSQLSNELGATPGQAAGAAGAIFAAAKSKMSEEDWFKLQKAIPGTDELMQSVQARPESNAATDAMERQGVRGSASLTGAFSRLGLQQDQIPKAANIVSDYVSKTAGPEVGKSFASALM